MRRNFPLSFFGTHDKIRPMKALIISDAWHPQVNGVVRTYEYLNKELERQGHDVAVIGPADFKHRFPMPGYAEIELVLHPYKILSQKIIDFTPDILHIATEGPLGWAARKYCLRHGKKFTTSYHTQFPDYVAKRVSKFLPFLHKPAHKIALSLIKKFHAPSQAILVTTKSMSDQLKEWGLKTPIMPFTRGIDTALFYPAASNALDHLPRPIALYVGRLAVEKNIEEFLEMEWQGSKVVIGHGPEAKALQKAYPDAHFLGKKTGEDLANHYRAADVFVFPSLTDTFGIVIIEALACGLPIAAHDAIGPKDIITDKTLGALDENLRRAAKHALENGAPDQRFVYIKIHYTWEAAARQFLKAHEEQAE